MDVHYMTRAMCIILLQFFFRLESSAIYSLTKHFWALITLTQIMFIVDPFDHSMPGFALLWMQASVNQR